MVNQGISLSAILYTNEEEGFSFFFFFFLPEILLLGFYFLYSLWLA